MSMELGNDMALEPVLRGLRLYVHSNVNDRELLIDHILATQGQLEENPSNAAFCLAASYPHDAEQTIDILSERSGSSVILDESWIWKCLYLKHIVPWYPYVLKSTTSRVAMNSITNITLDTETRDLQELCTCLARHLPFVRQGSKAYDEIFIYLSEKFPHRSEKKFRELYGSHNELINSCVERLEKQFDAILPPSEQLHPSDFLALRNEASSLKNRTIIPHSLPSNTNGSSGLLNGRFISHTAPNGVQSGRERDFQVAQQLSTMRNPQSNTPLVTDNNPAPGLPLTLARRLYLAVAIPRITYAVDIWYTPPHRKSTTQRQMGSVSITRKLSSIQRLAAISITGALRTTAGDAAEVHANLFSIRTLLLHCALRATARLATLPKSHPLYTYVSRASKRLVRRHCTTLHHLFQIGDIDPSVSEKITSSRRNPNYNSLFCTVIDEDKEQAKERDDEEREEGLRIYTDGSGYDGNIGAAAALYKDGELIDSLTYHLGTEEEHTVFEAELVGILLGLQLAKKIRGRRREIIVNLDNQAAIKALGHQHPQPGQTILDKIHDFSQDLRSQEKKRLLGDEANVRNPLKLTLAWVPGHEGAEGNEKADELAKQAATGTSSNDPLLPPILRKPLPISTSATKQRLLKNVKAWGAEEWRKSKRYERMKTIDSNHPMTSFQRLIHGAARATTSILVQLRTKHFPLNSYLHRVKRTDNPSCPHCGPNSYEDLNHYLRLCPKYREIRHDLFSGRNHLILDSKALYSTKKGLELLTTFINATGRFKTKYPIPKQRETRVA